MIALVGPSVTELLTTFGLLGLIVIVFVESGLLIGFFLPGDSLLFTAGLLAATGHLPLGGVIVGAVAAAILGDQLGYVIGRRAGPVLLAKPRRFLRRDHVARAEAFFEARGARAVVLARFIPVVRTITPVAAGAVRMPYRSFVSANVVGGLLWGGGLPLAGAALGEAVPDIDRYLLPMVLVIVVASVVPAIRELRHVGHGEQLLTEPGAIR